LPTADGLTYRLYNYSKQTTYDRAWNDATMAARGLIVCEQTGEIVAASMGKFFNMGEIITPGRAASLRDGHFDTFDKKDGSCGIQYRLDGKVRWATRGAFFSDQAQVAQSLWDERYKQHDELLMTEWNHLTLTAEIIHRATRVVCIYPYEDLVLIAARNRFTGEHIPYAQLLEIGARLGMRVVEKFDFPDAETVLNVAADLDGNTEGFVLCWDDGYRLKVKGEKYKEKHRRLTGITARTIAEAWYDGTLYAMLVDIPEEFRLDAERVMQRLEDDTIELVRSVEEIYATAAGIKERKDYAAWVKAQDKRLTGFLHSRRARDERGGAASIARATLANVIMTGYVYSLLMPSQDGSLADLLRDYQQAMAMFLWDKTRSRELVNKAKGIAPSMPKQLRSSWDSALVNLQPDLMVERLRDFVRTSDIPEVAAVDVDAVMAAAPSPTSPEQMHHQWVHSQPGLVRTFLDRWRYCGRGETAHVGARKLFADAVRAGVAAEFLTAVSKVIEAHQGKPGFDVQALIDGLARETALLENDWNALPHGSNPQEISAAAAALGDRSGWAKELLSEAWSAQRAQVRDLYIASDPQLSSLSRLEDA
jgi:RNA ligase